MQDKQATTWQGMSRHVTSHFVPDQVPSKVDGTADNTLPTSGRRAIAPITPVGGHY